jgi:hypothetical protein
MATHKPIKWTLVGMAGAVVAGVVALQTGAVALRTPPMRSPGTSAWGSPRSGSIASSQAGPRSYQSLGAGHGCSCPSTEATPGRTSSSNCSSAISTL